VLKKNVIAAKLTGDDPPTAAENLKLLLCRDADANTEAFYHSERVVGAFNWVIAADNDYWPTQCLGHWPPKGRWALFSTKQVGHIVAPVAVITDEFCAVSITGKPNPSFAGIWEREAKRIGLFLLTLDLASHKRSQIGGRGCFAGLCFA
jgi:hypothetical protein